MKQFFLSQIIPELGKLLLSKPFAASVKASQVHAPLTSLRCLDNGPFAHTIDQQVRLAIGEYRSPQALLFIIIVDESSERCLDAAQSRSHS